MSTDLFFSPSFNRPVNSLLLNDDGNPLVVFRGEHGESKCALETRSASLSFGDFETARLYALHCNDQKLEYGTVSPRIIYAYLCIERPFVNQASDPFVELEFVHSVLGETKTRNYIRKFSDWIENTNAWYDRFRNDGSNFRNVIDVLSQDFEGVIRNQCVNVFPLLDDASFVADLRSVGFDGAIYGGCGANFGRPEYRIFDKDQAVITTVQHICHRAPVDRH